jgi:chorismate mutase/prephenate dehydratase
VPLSGDDKTSIIVAVRNKSGALYSLLAPFHQNKLDLTRVETRPSRTGVWSYVFFIDFIGHTDDPVIQSVLNEITDQAANLRVLGSYPRAVL